MTVVAPRTVPIETHRSIAALAEEWDELADRTDASPFVRPGWLAAWIEAFGGGAKPLILAAYDEGRLTGVLPLLTRRGRLRSPTNSHTPVFDAVVEDRDTAGRLVGALLRRGFQQLDLGYLDARGALAEQTLGIAAAPGVRTVPCGGMRSPYVPLDGDFDSFREGLARNFRRGLARRRRRLTELGDLTFEFSDGGADLERLLDEGFELEASGWKLEEGTAIVSSPRRIRFYRDLAEWARSRGWLTLAFARLDGRPIAFDLCLEQGGRMYVLKGGYDPELAKYGASFLLIEESIARAFAAGHETYELLGDADEYKLQLTQHVHERTHLRAFGGGPAGRLRHLGHTRVRPLLRSLDA